MISSGSKGTESKFPLRAALGLSAGRSGGRDGGGNRFAPLAEQGGGAYRAPAAADWRAVVRLDMQSERPAWPATCYGHSRGQARAPWSVRSILPHVMSTATTSHACFDYEPCPLPFACVPGACSFLTSRGACRAPLLHGHSLTAAHTHSGARAQACDWAGDISFEEARWAQLQAVAAGRPPAALAAEMAAARAAQDRLYQVPAVQAVAWCTQGTLLNLCKLQCT